MNGSAPQVLVVDDEVDMRDLMELVLEGDGFRVVGKATSGVEGVRCYEELEHPPAAVVVDQRMPGIDGVETAELILERRPNQVIVLFSASLDADLVERALGVGVLQCIDKSEFGRLPRVLRTLIGL